MRRALLVVSMLLAGAVSLLADRVTLPAAASIVGGAPFFSDVRAFNTSYTDSLDVTGTYRCFIATVACPAVPPQIHFTLAPRESKAFNDICADAFNTPNTAGGVEFDFDGVEEQLVVTSRLYSTKPFNSVGMFIPGLDESQAHATTILTSIRHNPAVTMSGFRTNVGVFNPGDGPVTVSFTIFDGGTNQVGVPVARTVAGHSGVQVSGIFEAAGAPGAATDNAVILVSSSGAVFSYAAVIANATTDPIFVVGAPDLPPQAITPVPTVTGAAPTATRTPTNTPPVPTPTNTPPAAQTIAVNVGQNGARMFSPSTITIHAGDTVHWVWFSFHSTTSNTGVWDSGEFNTGHTFDRVFNTAGTFPYHCTVHGLSMSGTVVVNP